MSKDDRATHTVAQHFNLGKSSWDRVPGTAQGQGSCSVKIVFREVCMEEGAQTCLISNGKSFPSLSRVSPRKVS